MYHLFEKVSTRIRSPVTNFTGPVLLLIFTGNMTVGILWNIGVLNLLPPFLWLAQAKMADIF